MLAEYWHLLLSLPKTLRFNLHYLGWSAVWRMPIVVSRHVLLKKMAGCVLVEQPWQRAMVRIGFGDVAIFDRRRSRSIWSNRGAIRFQGCAILNHGSRISVETDGELILGDGFHVNAASTLVCRKKISFGRNCLLSWHVLVMDSDMHRIVDLSGRPLNDDREVAIGHHVWIGCRALILKGSRVASNSVIAAQAVVSGVFEQTNVVIAGSPARVIREGIDWQKQHRVL